MKFLLFVSVCDVVQPRGQGFRAARGGGGKSGKVRCCCCLPIMFFVYHLANAIRHNRRCVYFIFTNIRIWSRFSDHRILHASTHSAAD
jgi:hypothetical protein